MSLPPIMLPEPEILLSLIEEVAGARAHRDADAERGMRSPHTMSMALFQVLLDKRLQMRALQARGQDNAPGFAQRLCLLEQLLASAPWIEHPDMGLWPKPPAHYPILGTGIG